MPQKEQVHPSRTDASDRKLAEDTRKWAEGRKQARETELSMRFGRPVSNSIHLPSGDPVEKPATATKPVTKKATQRRSLSKR